MLLKSLGHSPVDRHAHARTYTHQTKSYNFSNGNNHLIEPLLKLILFIVINIHPFLDLCTVANCLLGRAALLPANASTANWQRPAQVISTQPPNSPAYFLYIYPLSSPSQILLPCISRPPNIFTMQDFR